MSQTIDPTIQQERAVSLFEFIRELNKLKQRIVLNMNEYLMCRPLSGLPEDPEHIEVFHRDRVEEDAESDQSPVLLRLRKPELEPCPQPPANLEPWLLPGWDSFESPLLVQDLCPHTAALDRWKPKRDAWVQRQMLLCRTRELFTDLYKRYFELERDPETLEFIVANGILLDREDPNLCHPVLTKRVKLLFDPDENVITIEEVDAQSELYSVVFQTMSGINLSAINQLQDDLRRNDYHPLDRNETPDFLKILVRQLSSDSLYSPTGIPRDWQSRGRLLIYTDPCYILRRRLDGTPKAIERIIAHIQDTGFVPAPIGDIVSGGKVELPEDTGIQSLEGQLAAVGGESPEILLSKEANSEQLEIARRIDRYNAVLVQGPPGTGKTHTIANLMGHFLAQGRSVLVTSHTPKALSVLKDKVPQGLQNLCVSVLEDSNVDMERSIDGISEYMSRTTSHELRREMDLLAQERGSIIDELARVRRRIFELIRQECSPIDWHGEALSPSAAARFVLENQDDLSYISGKVDADEPLPLTRRELVELYRTNEDLTPDDERELAVELPHREELLSPMELEQIIEGLNAAREQLDALHRQEGWSVRSNPAEERLILENGGHSFEMPSPDPAALERLRDLCAAFGAVEPWMKTAAVDGRTKDAYRGRWETLIDQIRKTCDCSAAAAEASFGHDIDLGGQNAEALLEPLKKLEERFRERGRIGKLTLLFNKDCEQALNAIRFDGRQLSSAAECAAVQKLLELEQARTVCGRYWDTLLTPQGAVAFAELDHREPERTAQRWIAVIERCLNWYEEMYQPLLDRLNAANIPENAVFQVTQLDSRLTATDKILSAVARDIPQICGLCLAVLEIRAYERELDRAKALLQSGGRVASHLCAAAADAIEDRDPDRYADACGALERMCEKYAMRLRRRELLDRLMVAAPQWAEDIRRRKGIHGKAQLPDTVEDAWKWKQLSQIVAKILEEPYARLQTDSLRLSQQYRRATADYAEKCAWYHLMRRTEGDVDMRQALLGWKQTVKKIGKGTGKNAPALKARARELMSRCQKAVPGWIMPMGRALESLDPRKNSFDVIIIDEASQSDVSSLAILYMGKKLIIVGDDKQVSPMAVGVDATKMSALQQMYIQGKIPNAHLYDAKTSIYDIARTTFQPLMLREHFRCVPQIIGFSNLLSYDGRIKPLREAGSSDLLPAVVRCRIPGGARADKRKINHAEAEAITALMLGCMAQPEYDGKTFGVISMLGDDQVKLIQQHIERTIGAKEIIRRKILCGSASHFQGDERDVIFLSLVDSGTGKGPLGLMGYGPDDAYRKRYNVAASRARDQLWVVDSLDPGLDLKPGDLRKTLIDYASNPNAHTADRQPSRPVTDLEARVARELEARGYRLERGRTVGTYRLELVALCGGGCVAIECDGEALPGGEGRIREDMERQTILQRLGWRFIRIRGSEFDRDPKKAMDRVARELDAFGITPETDAPPAANGPDLVTRVQAYAHNLLSEPI